MSLEVSMVKRQWVIELEGSVRRHRNRGEVDICRKTIINRRNLIYHSFQQII